MEIDTSLSGYGDIYLLCGYGGETLVIVINSVFNFDMLLVKVSSHWKELDSSKLLIYYSIPEFPRCVLANESDFKSMVNLVISYGLVRVRVEIVYKNETANIVAPIQSSESGDVEQDLLPSFCPNHTKILLTAGWEREVSFIGQTYEGGAKEFRIALRKTAIGGGFDFKFLKNNLQRVTARCKKENCTWYVHATTELTNDFFYVKKINTTHTCGSWFRALKQNRVSAELVSILILEDVRENLNTRPIDVVNLFSIKYGLSITYKIAFGGVVKARNIALGDMSESFGDLRLYIDCVLKSNPKSHIVLDVNERSQRFRRLFVSLGSCIEGFNYCRPLLFLDGTFLKNKFCGHLLCATAKDGDNGLYPLAFAVVDSENIDNWEWFLFNLKEIVNPNRMITFVSDRNPGLLHGMSKIFPGYPHGHCLNHMKMNLKDKFSGRHCSNNFRERLVWLFRKAAYAPTVVSFTESMDKFIREGGAVAKRFVDGLDVTNWANSYFKGQRYGEMSSNAAESFNSWILKERFLPIKKLVDHIRVKMMKQIRDREIQSRGWTTDLCPSIVTRLSTLSDEGRLWAVTASSEYIYEVHSEPSVEVNVHTRTCTCMQWQLTGLPCTHALACILRDGRPLLCFIESYFHTATYKNCYSYPISPVPMFGVSEDSNEEVTIDPPTTLRPPGRPRKRRMRSRGEVIPRSIKCGRCGKVGRHNKKTCTEPLN